MSRSYKTVLFDFDGTLADSLAWFVGVVNALARKHRFRPFVLHRLDCLRRLSDAVQVMHHFEVPWRKLPLVADLRRQMGEKSASIVLVSGIGVLLKRLHGAGTRIDIFSANLDANVRAIFGGDNVARVHYLARVVSLLGKPAEYRSLLRRAGTARHETLCVGDEVRHGRGENCRHPVCRCRLRLYTSGYARCLAYRIPISQYPGCSRCLCC